MRAQPPFAMVMMPVVEPEDMESLIVRIGHTVADVYAVAAQLLKPDAHFQRLGRMNCVGFGDFERYAYAARDLSAGEKLSAAPFLVIQPIIDPQLVPAIADYKLDSVARLYRRAQHQRRFLEIIEKLGSQRIAYGDSDCVIVLASDCSHTGSRGEGYRHFSFPPYNMSFFAPSISIAPADIAA